MHGYLFALAHQYGRIARVQAGMCWSEERILNVESAMTIRQTCAGLMCQCLAVSVPLVSVLACSAKSMLHSGSSHPQGYKPFCANRMHPCIYRSRAQALDLRSQLRPMMTSKL